MSGASEYSRSMARGAEQVMIERQRDRRGDAAKSERQDNGARSRESRRLVLPDDESAMRRLVAASLFRANGFAPSFTLMKRGDGWLVEIEPFQCGAITVVAEPPENEP